MKNHYCPNVDRLIVCILLALIDLTALHVGIDFNSYYCNPPRCGSGQYQLAVAAG